MSKEVQAMRSIVTVLVILCIVALGVGLTLPAV
jgi:hypothetical protein